MTFSSLARITALLSFTLAGLLFAVPQSFMWLFNLEINITGEVMTQRAAILFLAPALILWQLHDIDAHSKAAKAIAKSIAVLMLAFTLLGLSELALGRVGLGIGVAVITEALLFVLWFKTFKSTQK